MKKLLIALPIAGVLAVAAYFLFFREPVFKATKGFLVNVNDKGVIIEGYDPVSYFTEGKPVKGNLEFTADYEDASYWFSSTKHADLFKQDPKKYVPQYGAFCGYAVSIGKLRPADPTIFQIENGRLILQHTQEAFQLFNKNLKESTQKADHNWPGIVESHVGKLLQYDKPAQPATAAK